MSYLDTPHKKKSAVLTTIIMGLILFLIFTFGMTYFDPPKEYGIAVNFGTSDVGSGDTQSEPEKSSTPEEIVEEEVEQEEVQEVEEVQETPTEAVSTPTKAEDVVTQDNAETIRINKQKEAQRIADEADRKVKEAERQAKLEAERIVQQRKAAEAKKQQEEADKKKKLDALMGGLNNGNGKGNGGDGDDNQAGDKGQLDGDPYANSYYGTGGDGGGGYGLSGRNLLRKGQGYKQDCNEYGRVVVKIEVDKNGKVVKAIPGVKGSTNTTKCLLDPAERTALSYKWNFDAKAPLKQIGFIIVNFNQ